MTNQNLNLIWIDLEMTGLDPLQERIIEIATVVTDSELNVLAKGVITINQSNSLFRLWMNGITARQIWTYRARAQKQCD